MDCNTARLYLRHVRPGEAEELDAHLAHCSECNALALAQDRLDQHLGRAMLAVEVPRGLKDQILERVAAERPRWYRRFRGPAGALAAAAALLLLVGAWYAFYKPSRTVVDLEQVLPSFNASGRGKDYSNDELRLLANRSVPRGCAPGFVKYEYLVGGPSLAVLPGTAKPVIVPQFVFARPSQQRDQCAVVFALSRREFELDALSHSDHGYRFRLDSREEGDFIYLVFHTGSDWRWLEEVASE